MNKLEGAKIHAHNAMVFLTKIRDEVGNLDNIYESDLIDNRGPWTDLGAYQYISRAIRRLEQYIWEIEEAESDGESE